MIKCSIKAKFFLAPFCFSLRLNEHYKKNLPDKVAEFQDKFQKLLKEVKKLLKAEEFQFFQTISASGEGMFALLGYEEDGMTPYMIFYKLGLQEEKQVNSVFKLF